MYDKDKLLQDLQPKEPQNQQIIETPKKSFWKLLAKRLLKGAGYFVIFCFIMFGVFYARGRYTNSDQNDQLSWINKIPLIGQIKSFAEGSTAPLKGEERGRINILLLGIGGKGHDGGELTDTIMVLSIDPVNKKAAMLSIPRDLSVPIESIGWRKINHVNAYAEQSQVGSGGLASSQAVGDLLNSPIDYYVKVDFAGFKQLIDEVGGVEVCVDNSFDDYTYPAEGQEDNPVYASRYEHLHIEKGCQKMDSTLALKYARSRHAFGSEGSDFARAARQQKVIQAVKAKMLSKNTLLNPQLVAKIVNSLSEHIDTNMDVTEMAKLWTLVKDIDTSNVATKVLSNSPEGLLVDSRGVDGAYLLLPRTGNYTEIQYLFKNLLDTPSTASQEAVKAEGASIQILNGTWINGLASKTSVDLEKLGFKITGLANASRQDFENSVIYDLTFGQKEQALKLLKEKTDANVSFTLPDWLKNDLAKSLSGKEQPDLVLIIGQDLSHTNKNQ